MENKDFDLAKFDKVLADVAKIQEEGNFLPDCSTKEGYEASKRFVLDVTTPARKQLEVAHKETKKPFWDACKFLDEKKKELMPLLEAVELPHKQAYKFVDEEKKRIKAEKEAKIQKGFDDINMLVQSSVGANSELITKLLTECTDFDVDPEIYGKRVDDLIQLQQDSVSKLTDALTQRIQFEDMERKQAEIEAKQREIEEKEKEQQRIIDEQERKEREFKIAEQARIDAEERAKQQLIEQKEKAKRDAELAEQKRLDDIEAAKQAEIFKQQEKERIEKEEAAAREANKKYLAGVHNGILSVLVSNGIAEKDGKKMIELAAKGLLPQLSINY